MHEALDRIREARDKAGVLFNTKGREQSWIYIYIYVHIYIFIYIYIYIYIYTYMLVFLVPKVHEALDRICEARDKAGVL